MSTDAKFLASAVAVPEAGSSEPTVSLGKRRLSLESEGGTKRLKTVSNEPTTSPRGTDPSTEERETSRKRIRDEERQRGKRLFSGLVGALSQTQSTSSVQRKRAEIEKRGQQKLRQQTQEYIQLDIQQSEKIKAMRIKEQVKVDEETMRIRHANASAAARSLETTTQPALYYLPWKLLPEQEQRIDEQIRRTNELIQAEVEEFHKRQAEREALIAPEPKENADTTPILPESQDAVGPAKSPMAIDAMSKPSPKHEQDGHTNPDNVATVTNNGENNDNVSNETSVTTEPKLVEEEKDEDPDDHGEVVHEAEDMVIY